MSTEYVVWLHKIEKNACDLLEFSGFKKSYRLKRGKSLIEVWPDDVQMTMNEDHPDDTQLVDALFNIGSLLVISTQLKNYLETQVVSGIEYLPVNIKNHKGRFTVENYFIINLTDYVDCLDAVASQVEEPSMTREITEVKGIMLKNKELLEGRKLLRLKNFGKATLVEKSLADDMDAQGFTGIKWGALQDFTDKTW